MINVFNCHLCDTKKTTFEVLAATSESKIENHKGPHEFTSYNFIHEICMCNSCRGYFYRKSRTAKEHHVLLHGNYPQKVADSSDAGIVSLYPAIRVNLNKEIDSFIKRYFSEATICLNGEAYDGASVMFRKCVFRICNEQKIPSTVREGERERKLSGKERIKKLGLPKELNDVLCGIDGLGGDAAHIDEGPYSVKTLHTLKEALVVVFRLLYEDREMLKNFTKRYSQEVQERKNLQENKEKK